MKFYSNSPEETQALGSRMGALANKGELFLLSGELGSGKTTFVQGFAWGAGVEGYAHSPTFILVNQYQGRIKINHVDLYRVEGGNLEAHDLGFEEMLDESSVLVEWYENAEAIFDDDHIRIEFYQGVNGSESRVIEVKAKGHYYEQWIVTLTQEVFPIEI